MKLLYQWDVTEREVDEFLEESRRGGEEPFAVDEFCLELVQGTLKNREPIDAEIQRCVARWSMERMSAVDRNILRLAVYEIIYRSDIPPKATINEAIEIAKKFSSQASAAFVNGVLDRIHHAQLEKGAEEVTSCG